MATVVNSTAITVQWDRLDRCSDANGNITMYRVQFLGQLRETLCRNIDPDVSIDVPGQYNMGGQITVSVTPFTDYSIQVAAVNEEGEVGVYSSAVTRTTPEGGEAAACGRYIYTVNVVSSSFIPPVPGPVTIVADPSFFKILFTWDCPERPNGVITQYEVEYLQTDQSPQSTTRMNVGLVTEFTVSELEVGTEIRFSVRAYTGEGAGEWTSVTNSSLRRPRK